MGKNALKWNLKIGYNYISQVSLSRFKEIEALLNLLFYVLESEVTMKHLHQARCLDSSANINKDGSQLTFSQRALDTDGYKYLNSYISPQNH